MATYTNSDRILQAVLKDSQLATHGNYNPADYENIDSALSSDNHIVCAVAKIIDRQISGKSQKEIYNEVNHYLQETI